MKQIVILKDSKTTIKIYQDYMVITKDNTEGVVAFRYIKELYINKNIELSIKECVDLSKIFKIFLIDRYGNVLVEVKSYEKV
jgi:hypothetical protein